MSFEEFLNVALEFGRISSRAESYLVFKMARHA